MWTALCVRERMHVDGYYVRECASMCAGVYDVSMQCINVAASPQHYPLENVQVSACYVMLTRAMTVIMERNNRKKRTNGRTNVHR